MLTFKDNKGQGLVEYALILVLVAVVVIVILALLGPAIGNVNEHDRRPTLAREHADVLDDCRVVR